MKISYNWLKQHLSNMPETGSMDSLLTQLGLEVEDISYIGLTPDKLEGLVIGEVVACEPHPNADKLKLTKVNIGTGELLHIVCGAPNVTKGLKVVVATPGITLYPISGEPFKIKKSKIRGEESNGMLCAEDEIGLGNSHSGLLILPPDSKVGDALTNVISLENDAVIEIGITPNHADACSHLGIARELRAAMLNHGMPVSLLYEFNGLPDIRFSNIENPISVTVANSIMCPRYAGLYISGITVQPSPAWLQQKLKSIGLKPINNIVDITNFVLHDIGQPIHAFDADNIAGNKITVRLAEKDEKIVTLDGVARSLNGTEMLICDENKPLAIAGVFGGLDSGVSLSTKNIFIESAFFNPGTVRKSARAHGLNTDASFRFERGTDPEIVNWALYYTAKLILDCAGGLASENVIDSYPVRIPHSKIRLRYDYLNRIIGNDIPHQTVINILESLNCEVTESTDNEITVLVPAYKNDVTSEIDLCEEILRVYGLNKVILPGKISTSLVLENKNQLPAFREELIQNLSHKGFNEIMTNSLSKSSYPENPMNQRVALLNPLSADLAVMRDTMLFTGLEAVAYNLNRNNHQLQLFEIGKAYSKEIKSENNLKPEDAGSVIVKYKEEERGAIYITGKDEKLNAFKALTAPTFYTLKTLIISLLDDFGVNNYKVQPTENVFYKYGLSFTQNNKIFIEAGAVNNSILKLMDINQEVFYADILLKNLYKYSAKGFLSTKPVPKFPVVRRDLSLLIDDNTEFAQLEAVARKAEFKLLKDIGVFDIYKGENLGEGKKSYALYFNLQDEEKTLDDKSINNAMQRIQNALEKELGAVIR